MDIVIQGPVTRDTKPMIDVCLGLHFVDKVILSTWEGAPGLCIEDPNFTMVRSRDPKNPGQGNINRQIVSTRAGLKCVTSDVCAKMRADQLIDADEMTKMHNYFNEHKDDEVLSFADGDGPKSKMFVIGLGSRWPFQPQDHVTWGYTDDVMRFWMIPLHPDEPLFDNHNHLPIQDVDYSYHLRMPIYLGAFYCANFKPEIYEFLDNQSRYLVDAAPNREEAMKLSEEIRDKIFQPFPPISMQWTTYGCRNSYPFHMYETQGEYYGV